MPDTPIWLAKLAAWTHDPAEKALVLLRDPSGHEGGTVAALRKRLFPDGIPAGLAAAMQRADHWASAADRPQFPKGDGDGRYPAWTQVRFTEAPILIHPLSGEELDLSGGELAAIPPEAIKHLSGEHFANLILDGDARRTALHFWRFGPEIDAPEIRSLWKLLPADTRTPDHTIWTHLDLSSAFATAFTADREAGGDGDAALLAMSFGPVQDFIAAARTTSDLWAGSHLLSRIAWEGIRVIAEALGPDAVVFPQLRGVPQVDLWLRDEIGLPAERFAACEWVNTRTDANPLFAAALPNKFVAIVPAARASALAQHVTDAVRGFVRCTAQAMLAELLDQAGFTNDPQLPCHAQLAGQLDGFPEVHWASVPFALITQGNDGLALPEQPRLIEASAPFLASSGFLGTPAWKLLSRELVIDGARFYRPNPGTLYPAIYDLLDRVAGAAKSARPFAQTRHEGYRCDLTGEAEWLTTDRAQLAWGKSGRKDAATLWNNAAKKLPGLLRKGEHLCALAMLKRLWPRHFLKSLAALDINLERYVVSTHTLALATSLEGWITRDGGREVDAALRAEITAAGSAALPLKLARTRPGTSEATQRLARALPAWLDSDNVGDDPEDRERDRRRHIVADLLGDKPEAYYALILMDGDRMGAWLSGSEAGYTLPYAATWHPQIRHSVRGRWPQLDAYLKQARPVSPARHMAISAALNDFALGIARHVVEDQCKGKLIYAGGDDVLAMVSVDDLPRCLFLLRLAYSGIWPQNAAAGERLAAQLGLNESQLRIRRGHALLNGRLLRLMGEKATASAGAVVAHHTAPLSAVLRTLRQAEKRAKTEGGRDAFSLTLLKRSGGAVELTAPWLPEGSGGWPGRHDSDLSDTPMGLLLRLRDRFGGNTSRRAAYLTQGWLEALPTRAQIGAETLEQLLAANLGQQLKRQGTNGDSAMNESTGRALARLASAIASDHRGEADLIRDFLAVAEFLAREGRHMPQNRIDRGLLPGEAKLR